MQRTTMIGVGLLIIGLVTSIQFSTDNEAGKSLGIILGFTGLFLIWNAYVANYNDDAGFAIFG